jgi:hypothetical protein
MTNFVISMENNRGNRHWQRELPPPIQTAQYFYETEPIASPEPQEFANDDKELKEQAGPFSPLWKEIVIVFVCTCGQMNLVTPDRLS